MGTAKYANLFFTSLFFTKITDFFTSRLLEILLYVDEVIKNLLNLTLPGECSMKNQSN